MKYNILVKLFISVITTLMLTHFFSVTIVHATEQKQPSKVEQFAEQWKQQLAKVSPFERWQNASLQISPLGPGTHSWMATVQQNKENLGYMIIHATEDGQYVLGEYGIGDETSMKYMSEHSDSLYYHSPMQSLIIEKSKQEILYLDLFNLEQLPLQAASLDIDKFNIRHGNTNLHASISAHHLKSYFSPYLKMPWLTSKPINTQLEDCTSIEQLLESKLQIRFVASAWNDLIQQTYSVTGYQKWGDFDLYLAVQQDNEHTVRYIPYDDLMNIGLFYQ